MSRKKQNVSEESTPKAQAPYDIGLRGNVDDFYAAVKAAEDDCAAKKTAYDDYDKKSNGGMAMRWGALDKFFAFEKAYQEAQRVPFKIRTEFYEGAFRAFLDNRPDNIQHIMANPGNFCRYAYSTEKDLPVTTLVALLDKSAAPDAVPEKALAEVTEDQKHDILDRSLLQVVSQRTIVEEQVAILLKAGANASYNSNQIMARALHHGAPAGVLNRLLRKGADCDEALQTMYNNRGYYGDTPHELKILQQAARIRELEEMVADLTGEKPQKQDAAALAVPAETSVAEASSPAAKATGTPIRGFRKVTLQPSR
jgi:hypothetical protein